MYQSTADLYQDLYAELVRSREQERIARRALKLQRSLRSAQRRQAPTRTNWPEIAAARRTLSAQH